MAAAFTVAEADREMLEWWLRAPTVAQDLALRAKVILASAAGEGVRPMARRLGVSPNTVAVWRRRYRGAGLDGLRTKARAGRPRSISPAKERAVISATLRKPKAAAHWSARRLAKGLGLSAATVHRIWQKYGLQPHRVETFKFSLAAALPQRGTRWPAHQGTGRPPAEHQSGQGAGGHQRDAAQAQGRDPLERATAGQGARAFGSHRASHLAKVRAAAASGGDFQVQPRPPVRLQIGRHHGALSRSARARAGLVRGRKVADPGA